LPTTPQVIAGSALALANSKCPHCFGIGRKREQLICSCVARKIFRAIWNRYYKEISLSNRGRTTLYKSHFWSYSRKSEEYIADVEIAIKHTLTPRDYLIFKFCYIQHIQTDTVCQKLNIPRGSLFSRRYLIEAQLGKEFIERGIWPIDEYFQSID